MLETFAPHNWYVNMYLRIGLIGATMLVLVLIRAMWSARRDPLRLAWTLLLATYSVAYSPSWVLGPVLAVALSPGMGAPRRGRGPQHPKPASVCQRAARFQSAEVLTESEL